MASTSKSVVTTSFVIQFGAKDKNLILTAEIDDRTDGGNKGNTSFSPGDDVYFLVFKSQLVDIVAKKSSMGTIDEGVATTKEVEQVLTFANENKASVSYPLGTDTPTEEWYGTNYGPLTYNNESGEATSTVTPGDGTVAKPVQVGVCKITYKSPCKMHKLTGASPDVPKPEYSVVVFILGKEHVEP